MPWNGVITESSEENFARGINAQTLKEERNGVYMMLSHVHKAIEHYMGFDLFAEDLGHGMGDVESQPLFEPFKVTFGRFGRKMNLDISAFSPSHE